ncbi:MAG: AAA family ATPase [Candidatus Scalindua rubra]|uniref:DNA replication and repair protein RecF n=1 Tax=Candidatus Scalindua brodae TaxID=237368 RepID=A0A0B0EHZ3_9BACT|nr:MAG: DNA replication and repair protein RecF [Candidatus Scalindua brodae]MBZ0108512.1 AAA family ATPase [Candidatus Scalindua rubra]TWU36368.1 DNA replication and repair protein RecF [Candidatus Brocadiaceae bacterium S225]
MTKIKSITISGIRGIKSTLLLNLDKRSILIFGENGSGKSSLTDAIEWYYSDGVEHLISKETGATKGRGSLRNLFIPDNEDAFINIQHSNGKLNATKAIDSTLKASISNSTDDFKDYLNATQSENLILRYRDLVEFIIATPGEKLEKLQNIIGFSAVTDVRSLLRKSAERIAHDIRSANYDNQKEAKQDVVLENLKQNAFTDDQLFAGANQLIKPLQIGKEIKSHKDIRDILKSIETKEGTALLEQISFHSKVGEYLTEIIGNIDSIHSSYRDYHTTYTELQKDPENIQKLQLLSLLKEGQSVLKNGVVQDDHCPLCLQEKSKIELIKELNERISELEELEKEKGRLEEQEQKLKEILRVNVNTIDGLLKEKLFKEEQQAKHLERIQQLKTSLNAFFDELKKELTAKDTIREPGKTQIDKKGISELAEEMQDIAKALTEGKGLNIKFQIYTRLFHAVTAYNQYKSIKKQQEIQTKQQVTFQLLFTDFIKRQEEALNVFLKMFSATIDEYYTAMNTGEKIKNIKLVPIKDKNDDLVGITIEYNFFDVPTTAPIAYFSESHINCLGLSFFLASVKAFNKQNKFFVLDDVISSFDRPHRLRFANLLTDKFGDYQILLFTHEQGFFELVASDVKSKGWLIQDFKWSKERGVGIEEGTTDIKDRILKKFEDKDTDGLGNDIRIYTEKVMKEIAYNIEAKVAFRYNRINEKRMASELLDAVHSRISSKGSGLKDQANLQRLKGMPMFIGNITSHDNEFTESIEDLAAIWEDVENTVHTFYCDEDGCKKFISIKYFDNVENKIRCGCGKLTYDWKK